MKITILQGAFLPVPPQLGGAVEKVWFQLGMEFARKSHQVTHISRAYSSLPSTETISSVRHTRVPGYAATNNMMLLKFRDLKYSLRALKAAPPADIMVTNTFFSPILARRKSQLGRIYVHVARYPKGQLRFYNGAARLQTVTSAIKIAMAEQAPQLEPIMSVVPYPIELPRMTQPASQSGGRVLLYTGRIAPEKGIGLLLAAFERFRSNETSRDWRLRIVGPWKEEHGGGGDRYLQKLKQDSQSISNYIDWVGPIFDKDQLAKEYASATLFCYPSIAEKGETFGLAPLEAMSHGCPAIVSDLACFRDFIKHGSNGAVFDHRGPDPEQALSQALASMASSDGDIAELGRQARSTAEKYSCDRVADLYLEDFRKVLSP